MLRRIPLVALVLAMVLLVTPPTAAKGPTEVEVRNLKTGTTTRLSMDQPELSALTELVGWPSRRRAPHLVRGGNLTHVATLVWGYGDGPSAWVDRVFSDGAGTTWIARRHPMAASIPIAWGRLRAAYSFDLLLAQLEQPSATTSVAPSSTVPSSSSTPRQASSSTGFDGVSFGWGAAAAVLLAGTLSLALRRRRAGRV
jgi:hypothetical protein